MLFFCSVRASSSLRYDMGTSFSGIKTYWFSVILGEDRFEDKGKFIQSDFFGYCHIKAISAHVFIFPVSPRSAHNHKAFTFAPLATFRLVADNGSWHPGRSIVAFFAPPTWSSGAASRPFGPWQRHVTSGLTGSIQATMTCTQSN